MTSSLQLPRIRTVLAPAATSCAAPLPERQGPIKTIPLVIFAGLAVALVGYVTAAHGLNRGLLLIIGLGLGFALFHSRFGFTSAWRQLISVGNGQGLRAHAVLLGTAATLVMLIASSGTTLFGAAPNVGPGPIGVALFVGAAVFAIGMQLGGACASGTLFAVGSGQSSILITLFGFIAGSVIYTAAFPVLTGWPQVPGIALADHLGWGGAWVITIAVLVMIVLITRLVQRRRTPPPTAPVPTSRGLARIVRGAWPMLAGAVVLGVLAGAVFFVSAGTWGVTYAFGLWGAKALQVLGFSPQDWAFWQQPNNAAALARSAWQDNTTLTNVGIMIGAGLAAAVAGAWQLHTKIEWRTVIAALLGGVLMGIGARLAGGCNIGAYLGGISRGSLHGWLWALFALGGTWVGLRLRTVFGLGNPKPTDSVC